MAIRSRRLFRPKSLRSRFQFYNVVSAIFNHNYCQIFRERKQKSPRLAPVHGERLPFLIVNRESLGRKRVPLIDCVVSWNQFLANPSLQINYNYYVSRQLFGALGRVFDLVPIKLNWHPFSNTTTCVG